MVVDASTVEAAVSSVELADAEEPVPSETDCDEVAVVGSDGVEDALGGGGAVTVELVAETMVIVISRCEPSDTNTCASLAEANAVQLKVTAV